MEKVVYALLIAAIVSWGMCAAISGTAIHFGWIGTLFGSVAGLVATISACRTEEKVNTRGGGYIYKSESPISFLMAHVAVGAFLVAIALVSVLGILDRVGK